MAADPILLDIADGVAKLTLNRPARANALDSAACAVLQAALVRSAESDVRVVVLTGAGTAFCAGQDLAERAAIADGAKIDLGDALARNWNPIVVAIRALEKPVLAAVNGVATGAGANLALACDIVVAARSARFIQPFCRLGLVPDAGGTYLLPRLVGDARARGLLLLGEPIGAEQAEAWGMIWKAVPDDELQGTTRALASRLAVAPTYGIGLTKQALADATGRPFAAQVATEAGYQRSAGASPDYAEAIRAFFAKRPPAFSGRPPTKDP
jgi:2-(1,2-epoxy-1,2-dihydrophenyl)acetyl-CoA isomerase